MAGKSKPVACQLCGLLILKSKAVRASLMSGGEMIKEYYCQDHGFSIGDKTESGLTIQYMP